MTMAKTNDVLVKVRRASNYKNSEIVNQELAARGSPNEVITSAHN